MVDLLINKACFVKKLIMFAISKAAAKVVGDKEVKCTECFLQ